MLKLIKNSEKYLKVAHSVKLLTTRKSSKISDKSGKISTKKVTKTMDPNRQQRQRDFPGKRKWENTQLGQQLADGTARINGGVPFTFMSYNILSQGLLESHPQLYRHNNPDSLHWDYRLNRIIDEINYVNPEILCLQEVEEQHLKKINECLSNLNYEFIYKKRTGDKYDGCAIYYNRYMFQLIERNSIEFYKANIELLNRENVALFATLELLSNPSIKLVVGNTHLLYNPRRQDVRLAQTQLLLTELNRIASNGNNKYLPILLAGDFNLQPQSAPFQLITTGSLNYENLTPRTLLIQNENTVSKFGRNLLPSVLQITDNCRYISDKELGFEPTESPKNSKHFCTGSLSHDLILNSVNIHNLNSRAYGTTFQDEWLVTDYIFYSKFYNPNYKRVTEGPMKLVSRYKLPTEYECDAIGCIPNHIYGSDHFSLAAKFLLKS